MKFFIEFVLKPYPFTPFPLVSKSSFTLLILVIPSIKRKHLFFSSSNEREKKTNLKTPARNLKYAEFKIFLWVILDVFHQFLELHEGTLQFLSQFFIPDEGTRQPFTFIHSF